MVAARRRLLRLAARVGRPLVDRLLGGAWPPRERSLTHDKGVKIDRSVQHTWKAAIDFCLASRACRRLSRFALAPSLWRLKTAVSSSSGNLKAMKIRFVRINRSCIIPCFHYL